MKAITMYTRNAFLTAAAIMTALLGGCAADQPFASPDEVYGEGVMVISVTAPGAPAAPSGVKKANAFDVFDNEDDKWGIAGENLESLRIIIVDGKGTVEHNKKYELDNAVQAGEYKLPVKSNDTKTIILVGNEEGYNIDSQTTPGAVENLKEFFSSIEPGEQLDVNSLRSRTLSLDFNSPDNKGLSLRTPLPITEIFTEEIPAAEGEYYREYELRRAAVKYSFRIVNQSTSAHTLEGIRINQITDREFLFPDADYETNSQGHAILTDYRTPQNASTREYSRDDLSLALPASMAQAVTALPPFYVPEGVKTTEMQSVSISLDGTDLDIWRDLQWIMPGETVASARPMVDLPRNSHVVVNITITDKGMSAIADVQPYAGANVEAWYGLDRDEMGNIVINRYPDGSYDVLDTEGNSIRRDSDGDMILKYFTDGSILCEEVVYKDYIHDDSEVDYIYLFEKTCSGGDMILVRQISTGGTFHGGTSEEELAKHDHDETDRALFVLDKQGVTYRMVYDDDNKTVTKTNLDVHGDTIIQANGFQFRNDEKMGPYLGTYIVKLKDGEQELRDRDGNAIDWPSPDSNKIRSLFRLKRK